MWPKYRLTRGLLVFTLRNLLLYFLLANAYLHLREELSLAFLSLAFAAALLTALAAAALNLRFWAGLAAALLLPLLLRVLFFLIFSLQRASAPGPDTDFLYFLFDKDFFPALLPYLIVWTFNFWALRKPAFLYLEAGFNALLILVVFWSQARYRITLYPHPSLFAAVLLLFLLGEVLVLLLAAGITTEAALALRRREGPVREPWPGRSEARSWLAFLWIIIPLFLILLFFLLGRFNQGAVRQGSGLMKPTLFRFDFSELVKLESEIELSGDLVLLFRKQGPAERILLRRFILSGYEQGRGFFRISRKELEDLPVTVPDATEEFPDPGYAARLPVRQEYFFVNLDPTSLIGMNYPIRVTPLTNWEDSSFQRIYQVHSRVSSAGPEELENPADLPLSREQQRHYTFFARDEDVRGLAGEIVAAAGASAGSRYRQAAAIRDYLKENYYYSLKPGLAEDGNQLHHFLFKSGKGYCSYFAFAMALLCRSLDIPARVAVGFYVDPSLEVMNFYEVRAQQAHAWVEVYFDALGWVEFDPSSVTLAPGEEYDFQLGFDFEKLSGLIEEILRNQHRLRPEESEGLPLKPRLRRFGSDLARGLIFLARLWYLLLPALYLGLLAARKSAPYLACRLARPRRDKVKHLYRGSLLKLACLRRGRRKDESFSEYAARLDAAAGLSLRDWTEAYLRAVFADAFSEADYREALAARARFLSAFRAAFGPLRRVAGFLNPVCGPGGKQ
jgi:transglutaminase-like putative cysteine protease